MQENSQALQWAHRAERDGDTSNSQWPASGRTVIMEGRIRPERQSGSHPKVRMTTINPLDLFRLSPSISARRTVHRLGKSRFSVVAALLAALATTPGCAKHGVSAPTGGSEIPPSQVKLTRQVLVASAERKDLTYSVNTVGTLEPERQTSIAAGVAGLVDKVSFKEGDRWTEQDLENPDKFLILIDQEKYRAALQLAQANEKRAEENLKRTEARLSIARDLSDRATRLIERQAISQEEATKWAQEHKVALAESAGAEAELAAARAAHQLAQRDLTKSVVRPPYAGQINQRRIAEGDYLKDETIIATIADVSRLRLITWVPEMAAVRVKMGDTIDFELAVMPQKKYEAKIFYLSTVADPQTHMFECKAEILSPDPEMKPGLFARVQIATDQHQNACVIPEVSVRASERGFVAFVPEPKSNGEGQTSWVANARQLELGFRRPGFVEVLSGIEPGERVVTRGSEALEQGTPIEFPVEEQRPETTAEKERKKNGKT
jgi:multidrug efflux system membrane fusion protein